MAIKFPWIYFLAVFSFGGGFYFPLTISYANEQYKFDKKTIINSQDHLNEERGRGIPIELELLSEIQYDLDEKIFVAEGDVQAVLRGALLKADRLEFNRSEKVLTATGKVIFIKGGQYFEAKLLRYEFESKSGSLEEVYGVINIDSLSNDLNLFSTEEELIEFKEEIIEKPIKNIKLKGGYKITAGNIISKSKIISKDNFNKSGINSWRIKSSKINIDSDGWFADEITFSNDPLNPAQTKINAKNVVAKSGEDNSTVISIGKSRLIIEDKISIPYKRNSKFEFGKGEKLRWNFGIDFKDRDGLFISRQLPLIEFSDKFQLSLEPQFLIQRAIRGDTNSYISPGSSFLSENTLSSAEASDIFGLKADLKGNKNNWNLDFSTDISTFNNQRFSDGYRYYGSLSKYFNLANDQKLKSSIFTAYRYKAWNGSLGESDIYYAFGAFLEKDGEINNLKSDHKYNIRIGSANYEAEEYSQKKLIDLSKTTIFTSIKSNYPLKKSRNNFDSNKFSYRYSPYPIYPGLNFRTEVNSSYSLYSNDLSQALLNISAGPELVLGNLDKTLFDFTRISVMPGLTMKDGSSPFKFDNKVDLRTISIEYDQQIYGPLLLSSSFEFNIDGRSYNYGKSLSSETALIIHRRSYDFGLFYQPYQKAGGITFRLNGFSFDGVGRSFQENQLIK